MEPTQLQARARACAEAGLEFFERTQNKNPDSADRGRYVFLADCARNKIFELTSNWVTGILTSTMLDAAAITGEKKYRESADLARRYLVSMQDFSPWNPRICGAIHEGVPGDVQAHPRDGLSAALGLLDHAVLTGNDDSLRRAVAFGEWFIRYAMEPGYPYWTLRFDDAPWNPPWHGSFHSGSGFFLLRLHQATQDRRFLEAACRLLDFYNEHLLGPDGSITVIRQHGTLESLDESADPKWAPNGWIRMHQYNDDFGALANLAAGCITGNGKYTRKALLFLERMKQSQRPDGGFGPAEWSDSIPNAAGMILIELENAKRLGLLDASFDPMRDRAAEYLMKCQITEPENPFCGAFRGMTGSYTVDPDFCNARAGAYAIMALLRYSGAETATYTAGRP